MTSPLKSKTLRAAIYSRVSEDRTGQVRSVAQQNDDARGLIAREGWTTAGEYQDNDRGASRYSKGKRPDWQRLLDDVEAGKIDVIVVWELSRGTRARMVWAAFVEACIEHGVLLCVGGKLLDPADPDDGFFLDLGMGLAVRESAMTQKRVLRAVVDAAAKGRPHGMRPYGYVRVYDERTGALLRQEIHEPEAAIVRDMARRVLGGESLRSVAIDLDRRGVPSKTGAVWSAPTVKALLIRPSMAGLRHHRGQLVGKADWPGIVTEADHYELLGILCDPARKAERPGAVRHLCTGVVQCAECGLGLGSGRSGPDRPHVYRCVKGHVGASMVGVDEAISALVCARLSRPDVAEVFRVGDRTEAQDAAAEAERLQAQLDDFYDAALRGELTPQGLGRMESALLPKIEDARARAAVAGVPRVVVELIAAADVRASWDALPIGAQREVLRLLGPFRLKRAERRGPFAFDPERIGVPKAA